MLYSLTVSNPAPTAGETIVFTISPVPSEWFLRCFDTAGNPLLGYGMLGATLTVPNAVNYFKNYNLPRTTVWQGYTPLAQGFQPLTNQVTLTLPSVPFSATVTVRGKCTGGYPAPSMLLEIYDKGVKIKSKTIGVASIGTVYEDSAVVTGAGIHGAQGRMVLTNALGSYEFLTPVKEFTLG